MAIFVELCPSVANQKSASQGQIGAYGNDAQMAQPNLKADRYPYVR